MQLEHDITSFFFDVSLNDSLHTSHFFVMGGCVVLLVFVRSLYEQDTEHVCLYGHFFGGVNEAEQILHLGGVFINISMSYFHLHTCHTTLSLAPECE